MKITLLVNREEKISDNGSLSLEVLWMNMKKTKFTICCWTFAEEARVSVVYFYFIV